MSHQDGAATARMAGVLFLVTGYAGAYVAAVSLPSVLGSLYWPVLGPWLALSRVDGGGQKTLLVVDGAFQAAGVGLLVGGLVGAGRQLVHIEAEEPMAARVHVVPQVSREGGGVGVVGRF